MENNGFNPLWMPHIVKELKSVYEFPTKTEVKDNADRAFTKLDAKIDKVEAKLEAKIDKVEAKLEAKIDKVETKVDSNFKWLLSTQIIALTLILGAVLPLYLR